VLSELNEIKARLWWSRLMTDLVSKTWRGVKVDGTLRPHLVPGAELRPGCGGAQLQNLGFTLDVQPLLFFKFQVVQCSLGPVSKRRLSVQAFYSRSGGTQPTHLPHAGQAARA
jgi:hypothetical protein